MKTLVVLLLLATPAAAHDWYPHACCSNRDCYPVECDTLSEGPNGSIDYTPLDKHFSRGQVASSRDEHCHVCIYHDAPLCVFTQQGS